MIRSIAALSIATIQALGFLNSTAAQISRRSTDRITLSQTEASNFARLALKCVSKEFPNKPDHVINDAADLKAPKLHHPAFYGCYDWHSSVHGHWMMVRLIRLFPELPEASEVRQALNSNLTAANIQIEAEYLRQPNRQSFERTYGWAWLLKLAEELYRWDDPDGKRWVENLKPLTEALTARFIDFLPKQTYPIRTGVHPNTAFGLAFAFDYAKTVGDRQLLELIVERSRSYFGADVAYPANWEPGGEDFFSAALMEADLMRRVMKTVEFRDWFRRFLPGLTTGAFRGLLTPVTVTDRTDPKLVHLDGLNLSRAWTMRSIARVLPVTDPSRHVLASSAEVHARSGLAHVASGDYAGEHWLASFAVYLLSTPAP